VLAGEQFIASVYMHILNNESLWKSTLLLVVWDEHGGIFDHVTPPGCPADEFSNDKVGFHFDRLGVRVPAVLISPWIDEGTVIEDVYDHASIPATVTEHFIGAYDERSPREKNAKTFLDVLTRATPREDFIAFQAGGGFDIAPPETGVDGKKRQTIRYDLPPADAHNPDREISILLRDQVAAVRQMELSLPEDQQTHRNIEDIRTEGQASEYIAEVMSRVQPTARVGGAGQ
jgi:phospholipase C